ncbi:PREDICTED: calmodulin-like protein 7 [Theobroma cacao]|uniref:Calmodulin-like protein 7 n=1 Tax=Theobroma cacao TaxID=3641 RepID=A0AB32V7C7_THECC|nr:PREDICTED: calmodulin-like protein 7 [Theobroma cacao]
MPTVLLRIFLVYNLVLDYLVPKKLKTFLPSSWIPTRTLVSTGSESKTHTSTSPAPESASAPASSACCPQRMDGAELKRVFQMFDKNGDGRITKKELNDSLENLGIFIPDGELTHMIEKIDVNGDNCVDIDEFGELYHSIMDDKDEEEDMKEAFNVFDQNGDGYISVDELRSVLVSLGLKQGKTIEDCKRMIMKVDVDGDGRVNFKEFKQMMKGGGFSALT